MKKQLTSSTYFSQLIPNLLQPTFSAITHEDLFQAIFYIQTLVCAFLFLGMFEFREQALASNVQVIQWTDFKYVPIGLLIIHVTPYSDLPQASKSLVHYLSFDFVTRNLHAKYVGKFRDMRVDKIIKWIYDFLYYSTSSAVVWALFRHEPWYPTGLGGTNYQGISQGYPQMVENAWLIPFYMFQTASHLYALLHLMYHGKNFEQKYWEFMLHHSLATYLLYFSAMYNLSIMRLKLVRYGVVVLAIHDLADIILSSGRAYNDLYQSKFLVYLQYALLKITWVYTRLYIFPQIIYLGFQDFFATGVLWQKSFNSPRPSARWACLYLSVQMSSLLLMHIYWTYYMAKVGASVIRGKNYRDQYDNRGIKLEENSQAE